VRAAVASAFSDAGEQVFEDGIESDFSRQLASLVAGQGATVIEAVAEAILSENVSRETAAEAVRWMGLIDDSRTYEMRVQLLIRGLESPAARVRDAAALGLSFLDAEEAIPSLEQAIAREPHSELRQDMGQVLEELKGL